MKKYFVTATGTEIGKTFITASLCEQLRASGKKVRAAKPIIAGWQDAGGNDTEILLQAQGLAVSQKTIFTCSPWRFRHAISPDMAAKREQRDINFDEVAEFCRNFGEESDDFVFIEGIGGVLVPLNDSKTILDLIVELRLPVILVAGSYLGSISHTLTAVAALSAKKFGNITVVINESEESPVPLREIAETIRRFCDTPVISVPRGRMPKIAEILAA